MPDEVFYFLKSHGRKFLVSSHILTELFMSHEVFCFFDKYMRLVHCFTAITISQKFTFYLSKVLHLVSYMFTSMPQIR